MSILHHVRAHDAGCIDALINVQKGIWDLHKSGPQDLHYNLGIGLNWTGTYDQGYLRSQPEKLAQLQQVSKLLCLIS